MESSDASPPAKERDFHHPFQPYEIQRQFMNVLYDCLENGKIGILESPTGSAHSQIFCLGFAANAFVGTGKSLSLLCGSITWLRDFERKTFNDALQNDPDDVDEPDWLIENARKQKIESALRRRQEQEARLARVREDEAKAKSRFESREPLRKRQKTDTKTEIENYEEAEFLLKDYDSEDEKPRAEQGDSTSGISRESQSLMEKLGLAVSQPLDKSDSDPEDHVQIFFCSRTHSQLSQFANEMRRVRIPPSISPYDEESPSEQADLVENLKHVTLGSRKQLCINAQVKKLGSATAINERCMELQQSDTPQGARCVYLPKKDNEPLVNDFRDYSLSKIRDIEDFAKLGKTIGICPYYASRAAVKPSEIVTLPYPLLLQKSAREALKLSLKGHVVIIDEAHNLLDAISNIHSSSVSITDLKRSRAQIGIYLQKFRHKLKGKNRVYVTQLVRIIDSLIFCLESNLSSSIPEKEVPISGLMAGKGVDQINLYKLMNYLQESKLARKVERYLDHSEQQSLNQPSVIDRTSPSPGRGAALPCLTRVQSFLMALNNPAAEGRFFYTRGAIDPAGAVDARLDYLLLDPTHHFKEIVDEARAVILAGGTMSPMGDYTNHLFHYLPQDRIETLSCGHIIPPSNLLVLTLSHGPSGGDFDFTFAKRGSEGMLADLGLAILDLARVVPDGVVVFFPSYAYLDHAVQTWQKASSAAPPLWPQLAARKRIFLEPKSSSSSTTTTTTTTAAAAPTGSPVDRLLADYTAHVHSAGAPGALLFAVIGGSLSEGINFSDRLGRAIAVVGLPFPNAQSAAWKAKMEFVAQRSRGFVDTAGGDGGKESANAKAKANEAADAAAREYYENACMRAVNQSVGRAIRHKDDYAAIVLLDRRYERESIRGKLPAWIQRSLVGGRGFMDAVREVEEFFEGKQQA